MNKYLIFYSYSSSSCILLSNFWSYWNKKLRLLKNSWRRKSETTKALSLMKPLMYISSLLALNCRPFLRTRFPFVFNMRDWWRCAISTRGNTVILNALVVRNLIIILWICFVFDSYTHNDYWIWSLWSFENKLVLISSLGSLSLIRDIHKYSKSLLHP